MVIPILEHCKVHPPLPTQGATIFGGGDVVTILKRVLSLF